MIELKLVKDFPREIVAVDEVGRSPLSGPVVIGALRIVVQDHSSLIALLRSFRRNGVKDSKLLPATERRDLLQKFGIAALPFRQNGTFTWKGVQLTYVTWEMDHTVIDVENIFQASMRGMKEAALAVQSGNRAQTTVLIDGLSRLRWHGDGPAAWEEIPIVKGDVKSSLIGLAAIIAKEKRDAFMRDMHVQYPVYGFDTNFGHPTPSHRRAIEVHGPSSIHRKSFGKVKDFIPTP